MRRPLEFVHLAPMLAHLESLLLEGFEEIEEWLHRQHHRHLPPAAICRFPGATYTNHQGDIIVATQTVPGSTALTGKLIFLAADGTTQVPGPIGTIAASDPAAAPSLSADGQSYNFTSLPTGSVTLTWHDPSGVVPDASCDFTDQVVVPPAATVSFGPAAPGTTA